MSFLLLTASESFLSVLIKILTHFQGIKVVTVISKVSTIIRILPNFITKD